MAGNILKKIDENFLQCSICLNQFTDPKLLSCQHKFCMKCLDECYANYAVDGNFPCPLCRIETAVLADGAKAIKNDIFTQCLLELVNLEQQLKQKDKNKQCESCCEMTSVVAYCPDCGGFICKQCYGLHKTNILMKSHAKMISISDIEQGHVEIDFERLSQLCKAPRCEVHLDMVLHLNCRTCDDVRICASCAPVCHVGHQLENMPDAAMRVKDNLRDLKGKLPDGAKEWNEYLQQLQQYKGEKEQEFNSSKQEILQAQEEKKVFLEDARKKCQNRAKLQEQEIELEFKTKIEMLKIERSEKVGGVHEKLKKEEDTIHCEIAQVDEKVDSLIVKLQTNKESFDETASTLKKNIQSILARNENFQSTADHVLILTNVWAAVDVIPNMNRAIQELLDDMKVDLLLLKELKELQLQFIRFNTSYIDLGRLIVPHSIQLGLERSFVVTDFKEKANVRYHTIGLENGTIAIIPWYSIEEEESLSIEEVVTEDEEDGVEQKEENIANKEEGKGSTQNESDILGSDDELSEDDENEDEEDRDSNQDVCNIPILIQIVEIADGHTKTESSVLINSLADVNAVYNGAEKMVLTGGYNVFVLNVKDLTVEASSRLNFQAQELTWKCKEGSILISEMEDNGKFHLFSDRLKESETTFIVGGTGQILGMNASESVFYLQAEESIKDVIAVDHKWKEISRYHIPSEDGNSYIVRCDREGFVYVLWDDTDNVLHISQFTSCGSLVKQIHLDTERVCGFSFAITSEGEERLLVGQTEKGEVFVYR